MGESRKEPSWSALLEPGLAMPLAVLLGGVLLHSMNMLVTATLLPSIVSDLGGAHLMSWPTTAFVASSGARAGSSSAPAHCLDRYGDWQLLGVHRAACHDRRETGRGEHCCRIPRHCPADWLGIRRSDGRSGCKCQRSRQRSGSWCRSARCFLGSRRVRGRAARRQRDRNAIGSSYPEIASGTDGRRAYGLKLPLRRREIRDQWRAAPGR